MMRTNTAIGGSSRRGLRGIRLRVAFFAAVLSVVAVAAGMPGSARAAVDTISVESAGHPGLTGIKTPALTPGLPPPQLASLSDRRIVAGVILVIFAGLSGITLSMWRDLSKRTGTS
jgi:hypothetical protein